ncbi:hypothetical protein NX059_001554 [Plenodomus lindquistii]|nr:hypothetical protein NX059_001554 [Plenodomus lindquistii]
MRQYIMYSLLIFSFLSALVDCRAPKSYTNDVRLASQPRNELTIPDSGSDTSLSKTLPQIDPEHLVQVATDRPLYLPYPFATDPYYNSCKCKGQAFLHAMQSSDADAGKLFTPARSSASSPHTDPAELTTWNWQTSKVSPTMRNFEKAWGVDHVLRALGTSDKAVEDGGTVNVVTITHGNAGDNGGGYGNKVYNDQPEYTVGGTQYRVTGGEYTYGFDPSGVILAMNRKSPKFAGLERKPKIEGTTSLPTLQSFSDVAWLHGSAVSSSGEPKTMRYFLSLSITNIETRGVIGRILSAAGLGEVPGWPGWDADTSTDAGAALLGTPNALAFSYMLIQRKAKLGNLRIAKVTVFKDSKKFPDPCLLFHVQAASAAKRGVNGGHEGIGAGDAEAKRVLIRTHDLSGYW